LPTAAAGSNSPVCVGGSLNLTSSGGTSYSWTGPNGFTSSVQNPSIATVTAAASGTYTVVVTDANGCSANATASVSINVIPTASNAGLNQPAACGTVTLAGNVPAVGTGNWTFAPGGNPNGLGSILTPSANNSGFNGTPGISYTLRWTISNGVCTPSSDDVVVTFSNPGVTASNAGPDQEKCNDGNFTLAANAPAATETGAWSLISGTATITTPASNISTVTSVSDSAVLRWTISDGATCTSFDNVTITNSLPPSAASAGLDQAVCGTSATLAATAPLVGTGTWTVQAGAGGTFTAVNNPLSPFTGTVGITYILRWTITNGSCSSNSDEVSIRLDQSPTIANAGSDQNNVCGTISLNANTPAIGTGLWSIVAGTGGSFSDANDPQSDFNGTTGITYTLSWTISNGACTASTDNVTIIYDPIGPTPADAGLNQAICGATTTTLAANNPTIGVGQWSFAAGGNPGGAGIITDVNNLASGFSGTTGVVYTLVWTITSGTCSSNDQVQVQFNVPPTTSNAGSDQSICALTNTTLNANLPSIGAGAWSFVPITGNPDGLGVIADVTNRLSGFTGTIGQTYTLRWTISSGGCTASVDEVVIAFRAISLDVFNTSHCINLGTLDLAAFVAAAPSGGALTFTGTQVTGSILNPSIPTVLTGAQTISVQYVLNGCSLTKLLLVNILPSTNPSCSGGGGGCSVPVIAKVDASCSGIADGSISINSVSGGVGPYQYSIDNGINFQPIVSFPVSSPNLSANSYSVVVRDNVGCLSSVFTIVIANTKNITSTVARTDESCTGGDGEIRITNPLGGTAPYEYSINNGTTFQSIATFSGLTTGTYPVVVKDNSGCLSSPVSTSIALPLGCGTGTCATVVITPVPSPATCTLSNGSINFNINPATPAVNPSGVKITITGISTTNSTIARTNFNDPAFPALPIGVYNYSIEYGDVSCLKTGQVTVDQSGTVGTPLATNIVGPVCAGSSTGSIKLDVPGETGNVLQWSLDGLAFTNFTAGSTITGVPAGLAPTFQRVISVRRNAGDPCNASITIVIQDASPAITTTLTPTDATCANNDGSILVGTVSGGAGPYTFKLNGTTITLPTSNRITAKSGGNYTLSVIDSKNCQVDFATSINFPGLVNYTSAVNNPDCSGSGQNGSIVLTITSTGTFLAGITTDPIAPPTAFQNVVSAGSTPVTFGGLSKGTYYVSLTPTGAACPTKAPFVINSGPDQVDFSLSAQNILCFENKGGVAISAIKGSPLVNYSYEIVDATGAIVPASSVTPPNPINQLQALGTVNLLGLSAGEYRIRLFQNQSVASGCVAPISSAFKSFTVLGPTAALDTLYVTRTISLPDQPTGTMLVGLKESQQTPYQVRLELKKPIDPLQAFLLDYTDFPPRNTQNLKIEYNIRNLFAGLYELKIKDALGCEKTYADIEIKVDVNIFIPNVFTPNEDGSNETFYIRNLPTDSKVNITNRWGAEVYSSSNYQNDWNGSNNADGVYFYRIVAGGNTFTGWVEIIRGK